MIPRLAQPGLRFPRRKDAKSLRNEKNLLRVGILDLGPRGKTAHVHITRVRRVRAGDEARFARHRNAILKVALGRLNWRSGRFRWRWFLPRGIWRRRRVVRIERLLSWRVCPLRRGGIF